VVVTFGQDPLLFLVAGQSMPYGMSEFDYCGGLRGAPIDVIRGELTGLPIPATAEIAIDVPMRTERTAAQAAYDKGCAGVAAHLDAGRDVVVLCEGDPFFYGSFMYIFSRLAKNYRAVVVPGVSSVTAAAAAIGHPLAARSEVLKVLPATLDADRLREELMTAESTAIIKVGRHFGKVRAVLSGLDLISKAVAVEKATRDDERITPVERIKGDAVHYFTTILVYAGAEKW
jgi:precorrin-2/cobalt-factor-2 C20-methyltransferase